MPENSNSNVAELIENMPYTRLGNINDHYVWKKQISYPWRNYPKNALICIKRSKIKSTVDPVGISKERIQKRTQSLGMRKLISARWLPQLLIREQKLARVRVVYVYKESDFCGDLLSRMKRGFIIIHRKKSELFQRKPNPFHNPIKLWRMLYGRVLKVEYANP